MIIVIVAERKTREKRAEKENEKSTKEENEGREKEERTRERESERERKGSSTQWALTWKPLCVPVVRMTRTVCSVSEQNAGCQRRCPLLCDSLLRISCWTVGQLLVSPFSRSSFSFVIVVYIMTDILTAELWCF